tara:strand:- start:305 stop:661 length:357 start_codon:yes stop_codon:yes gene_type:complete
MLLGALDAVLRTTLLAVIDSERIERTTDDVIPNTWKVTDTPATDENNGVLLEVVTFTTDVGGHFLAIGKSNASHLAKRRVGLLGCDGSDLETDTTSLWAGVHVTDLGLHLWGAAWFSN